MKPTILTCAVTGSYPTREHNQNLPVTPDEIAGEFITAAKAGAAMCQIHVRDPQTGVPRMELDYYREAVRIIKDLGGLPATVPEARQLLGLAPPS